MAGRSRWLVGSSRTSTLTPRACSSASAARVRSPGERVAAGRSTWSAVRPNFASRVRTSAVGQSGTSRGEGVEQLLGAEEPAARLVDLADLHRRAQGRRPLVQRHPAEQRRQQRRLAGPVRAGDGEPVAPVDLQVDRTEREVAPAHDRAAQGGHDRAGARRRGDLQPQLPLLARLLDDLQALDPPVGLLGLGALLLRGRPVVRLDVLVAVGGLLDRVADALGHPVALHPRPRLERGLRVGVLLVLLAGVPPGDLPLGQVGLVAAVVAPGPAAGRGRAPPPASRCGPGTRGRG